MSRSGAHEAEPNQRHWGTQMGLARPGPRLLLVIVSSILLLIGVYEAGATPPTSIVIDGLEDFEPDEAYSGTSASTWYFTWDAENFYFGLDASGVASNSSDYWVVLHIDTDVTGGSGTATGVPYSTQQPTLSFPADYHFRWKSDNTYINMLDWNSGTSSWTGDNTADGNFGISGSQSGTYVEFAIPRASLGSPSVINIEGSMINETVFTEYTFHMVPNLNSEGYDADFVDHLTLLLSGAAVPSISRPGFLLLAVLFVVLAVLAAGRHRRRA